jgi:hypothetical protein
MHTQDLAAAIAAQMYPIITHQIIATTVIMEVLVIVTMGVRIKALLAYLRLRRNQLPRELLL